MHLPIELGSFVSCTVQYSASFHSRLAHGHLLSVVICQLLIGKVDPKMNKGQSVPLRSPSLLEIEIRKRDRDTM